MTAAAGPLGISRGQKLPGMVRGWGPGRMGPLPASRPCAGPDGLGALRDGRNEGPTPGIQCWPETAAAKGEGAGRSHVHSYACLHGLEGSVPALSPRHFLPAPATLVPHC